MEKDLVFKLDFRQHEPIYSQIVAQVKQFISAGVLKPGDQLPTVRQLAADMRVNFNTVARAYRMLDEEGVISTQQGRGTYILDLPHPADQSQLRREKLEHLVGGLVHEARRLGYASEEVVEVLGMALGEWLESEGRQM